MTCVLLVALAALAGAAETDGSSGGPLRPEQAAYDVESYDLTLRIDPAERTISGTLIVRARLTAPLADFVLDLDGALEVARVREGKRARAFEHERGLLHIDLGGTRVPPAKLELAIDYGGAPRVSKKPPWVGGFTWRRTPSGAHWIATSNQGEGGDLWWPCKDHPADEPEWMDLHITVPSGLVCASNGRLERVEEHEDGSRTYHWHVSTPINNYGVALNIGPYVEERATFESIAGERFPVTFWMLPEDAEKGRAFFPEILEHLRFFERRFGPYPFRADKYGVVQTPHLGMEHQTIIAYGNEFREDRWGFDWLHHHELAHEWWGNMVSVPDWNDFWIHEGFATYAQNLYIEELHGRAGYLESMAELRERLNNEKPMAPAGSRTTRQMYFREGGRHDSDIYYKGACVLHTLRGLIGDEAFFASLRRMAYPTPEAERATDGSQCRFATTADFVALAEECAGEPLDWMFEVYLRRAALPALIAEHEGTRVKLTWKAPDGLPFPMPVDVRIGGELERVEIPAQGVWLEVGESELEVDPEGWVLRARR